MKTKLFVNKSFLTDIALIALTFITCCFWFYLLFNHTTFGEWDGVNQYFSGEALLEGHGYKGWASHFWPPLYPLLLAIGPPFLMGKIIAVVSGTIFLFSAYSICRLNNRSIRNSIFITLIIASNAQFLLDFSKVENHCLEAAMTILGLYFTALFLKSPDPSKKRNATLIFAAIFVAIAGLTRYTSYALALAIAISLLMSNQQWDKKLYNTTIFSVVFIAISLIWWIPNFLEHGSPFATWQYLNIGTRLHPEGAVNFWWIYQNEYSGLYDILAAYPKEFIQNFFKNIIEAVKLVINTISPGDYLPKAVVLCGGSYLFWKRSLSEIIVSNYIYILYAILYIGLCSMAFVFDSALLAVIFLFILIFFIEIAKGNHSFKLFAVILIVMNLYGAYPIIQKEIRDEKTDGGQLSSREQVTTILSWDKNIQNKTVMSIHGARAFYAGSKWIMFPMGGVNTTCDLLSYNFSDKVKNYAPKNPPYRDISTISIDYIIVGRPLARRHPFINEDFTFKPDSCSNQLIPILKTVDVAVYEVLNTTNE